MNTTERLKRAFGNPRLLARGLNRVYHRHAGRRSENTNGVEVFNEDWDTLIILDACRYDMFERVNDIDGKLSSKESKGSATTEWLQANVDGRNLSDTVYVTGNPQLERHRNDLDVNIHEIVNVWLDDGWDEETGTVLAETMTEAAIEAHNQYPNKRLVVHYMQPHYPFVPSATDFDKGHLDAIEDVDSSVVGENVWNEMFMKKLDVDRSELWEMYIGNLNYVLDHVENLLDSISGKTVITSDHGNYVGERSSPIPIREYGHPRGLYDKPVIRVPWLVCRNGERREISTEPVASKVSEVESETVMDRLHDLGYTA